MSFIVRQNLTLIKHLAQLQLYQAFFKTVLMCYLKESHRYMLHIYYSLNQIVCGAVEVKFA